MPGGLAALPYITLRPSTSLNLKWQLQKNRYLISFLMQLLELAGNIPWMIPWISQVTSNGVDDLGEVAHKPHR